MGTLRFTHPTMLIFPSIRRQAYTNDAGWVKRSVPITS
jgi:hypothetical protein